MQVGRDEAQAGGQGLRGEGCLDQVEGGAAEVRLVLGGGGGGGIIESGEEVVKA